MGGCGNQAVCTMWAESGAGREAHAPYWGTTWRRGPGSGCLLLVLLLVDGPALIAAVVALCARRGVGVWPSCSAAQRPCSATHARMVSVVCNAPAQGACLGLVWHMFGLAWGVRSALAAAAPLCVGSL